MPTNGSKRLSDNQITKRRAFSFAGCGFMGIYHIGVCLCIQEHAEQYFDEIASWYGASAGSMIIAAAACGVRATEGYKFIKKLHDEIYRHTYLGKFGAFHPSIDLMGRIRNFLESVLPKDAHRKCRNKVGVSLTVLPSLTNWIVTDFNTRAELIQAVVCSCFIPLFTGVQPPKFRGKLCCDGGLSNNLPYSSDPSVITVSPFSGECDICPNGETETTSMFHICGQAVQSSWKNLYRGFGTILFYPWNEMDEMCARGFHDAYSFIKKEGIVPIELPPYSASDEVVVVNDTTTDSDSTSDYFSIAHSRQSSVSYSVTCLEELLDELEERRDSSILLVEEEDCDSGIFNFEKNLPQLRWKIKPKAELPPSVSAATTISNRWHSLLETVWEYRNEEKLKENTASSSSHSTGRSTRDTGADLPFLPLPITA